MKFKKKKKKKGLALKTKREKLNPTGIRCKIRLEALENNESIINKNKSLFSTILVLLTC